VLGSPTPDPLVQNKQYSSKIVNMSKYQLDMDDQLIHMFHIYYKYGSFTNVYLYIQFG